MNTSNHNNALKSNQILKKKKKIENERLNCTQIKKAIKPHEWMFTFENKSVLKFDADSSNTRGLTQTTPQVQDPAFECIRAQWH